MKSERGVSLIAVVFLIVVLAFLGIIVVSLLSTQSSTSINEMQSTQAFYLAEGGIERVAMYLVSPVLTERVACASIPAANTTLGAGQFSLNLEAGSPFYPASVTLSANISSTATSLTVGSNPSSYAPFGRIMIDRELIDYTDRSTTPPFTFSGLRRGADGTIASSHVGGNGDSRDATVGQYQCTVNSTGGVTSLAASARGWRMVRTGIQLQEGWAVGNRNGNNLVFTRWNQPTEVQWTGVSVNVGGSRENLNAVSMLSYADGWAVGNERNNNFTIVKWNGSGWSLNAVGGACGGQDLNGVSAVSSMETWAVGARYRPGCGGGGPRRYTVMLWNGTGWNLLSNSTTPSIPPDAAGNQDLNAVHVIDTDGDGLGNFGFAVGDNGQALRYDGTDWVSDNPGGVHLNGVFVLASQTWAVGDGATIWRWQGGAWNSVSPPGGVTDNLRGISMMDTDGDGLANDGWAVGDAGRVIRIQWNGAAYVSTAMASGTGQALRAVAMFTANDSWAIGNNGVVIHWNGSGWTVENSNVTQRLNGISIIGARSRPQAMWREVVN
jgi:hypothetical protein